MLYYNNKTNELCSLPPWGNSYIDKEIKSTLYHDWKIVNSNFIPTKIENDVYIQQLEEEYNIQYADFLKDLNLAMLSNNTEAINSIQEEFKIFQQSYKKELLKLKTNSDLKGE